MKKILNAPADYVDEMLAGLCLAHPGHYAQPTPRVITRAGGAVPGKVGIVTGGGSGHLPVFTGYVGPGLLDACAIGDVFASPSADQMAGAMRHAHGGAGVPRRLARSAKGADTTSSASTTVVEVISSISSISPAMSKFITSPP